MNVPIETAHQFKVLNGLNPGPRQARIAGALQPSLEKMTNEVKRVMRYYTDRFPNEKKIEQILIVGGGGNLPGIGDFFTNELLMPARVASPWQMLNFDGLEGAAMEAAQAECVLAKIGNLISWIFTPLGWGDWKMTVAAITGLVAKENVVGTFGQLFGFAEVAEDGQEIWGTLANSMSQIAAYSFLVFNLLCAPCFAAMGAIKREMNNAKWFWFAIGYQCLLAYLVALCIFQFGTLFTGGGFGIGTVAAIVILIGFLYMLFRPYKESTSLNANTVSSVRAAAK